MDLLVVEICTEMVNLMICTVKMQCFSILTEKMKEMPAPSTPDQSVYQARTHFREKGVFFQWDAQIREIKKKRSIFRHKSAKFWKRVEFCMYLFPFGFSFGYLLCINAFELEPYIKSNEKYVVQWKMSWVWYSYSHFHIKG